MSQNSTNNVAVGISTYVGFAVAAAAAVAPIIGELADAAQPLGVPPTVWIVVSAVLSVVTVLGRMWQAAAAAGNVALPAASAGVVDDPALDTDAPDIGDADPVDLQGRPVTPPAQG